MADEIIISPLEKELAQSQIELPGNPFWEVFKRFGRDEMIAMTINVFGTAGIEYGMGGFVVQEQTRRWILTAAGPIIEKAGFFPAHFKEAWDVYKTTPKSEREPLKKYVKDAMKGGSTSLVEDILVHDPIYIAFMYTGLQLFPQVPAWMLATMSFITAVFAVAGLEVGYTEAKYWNLKRQLKKIGFGSEHYFESRFFISDDKNPDDVLHALSREFELPDFQQGIYDDRYFKTTLPRYSGRRPKLRLRRRIIESEGREVQTAQIIYTRTAELAQKRLGQFRFFPQSKDKFYFMLDQEMPKSIDGIANEFVREYLSSVQDGGECMHVNFDRSLVRSDDLFVSTDRVHVDKLVPFYVVEIKTHRNKTMLKEAMRYIMLEFPVLQVTHGKQDLVEMCS